MITFSIDVSDLQKKLGPYGDQVAFATSKALNDVALAFQTKQREHLTRSMTIRRPWVLQGVKIERGGFATKQNLRAVVGLDPKRDFLGKFEQGGKKTAAGGLVSIPVQARRTKADIIQKSQRPKALGLKRVGRGAKATVFRGEKRTFYLRMHNGTGLLFQRTGRGKRAGMRLLYHMRKETRIPASLKYVVTAQQTFDRVWPHAIQLRLEDAIRTARPR